MSRVFGLALAFAVAAALTHPAGAETQVERGKYLVAIIGCGDCHTPGSFFGKPDMSKFLGGSDVGFAMPGLGVFVPPNLTSDKVTGLGKWTRDQIVAAITKGERPDGRMLAPIMPTNDFAHLTKADALAIAAYLQSLPPLSNRVGGPFGPTETPTVFVFSIQPGEVYSRLPKPPAQ